MSLFRTQRVLMTTATLMALLAVFGLVAMMIDDRMLLGVSVWTKPVKFGIAFALYTATLAWLLDHPHRGRRWTRYLAPLFAVTAIIDVGFIVLQAARGTFSHFNTAGDPINHYGQIIFASGVPGLFVANLSIAIILLRQRIGDAAITVAMRIGMVVSVIGMGLGYLVALAGTQVVRDANGDLVELAGGHTFGANDGSSGLPIAGWSTVAGDLRIPHFLGLHAMQVLLVVAALLVLAARRSPWLRDERVRARLVAVVGTGWAAGVAITLWQALRGQSIMHPDARTLLVGSVVATVCVACVAAVVGSARSATTTPQSGVVEDDHSRAASTTASPASAVSGSISH
ncbi:hypothetical protein [Gordonia soli]|nr:hypothetical protein [Gordonia soli]